MSNPDSYVNVPILHESPIVHQENPVCEEIPLRQENPIHHEIPIHNEILVHDKSPVLKKNPPNIGSQRHNIEVDISPDEVPLDQIMHSPHNSLRNDTVVTESTTPLKPSIIQEVIHKPNDEHPNVRHRPKRVVKLSPYYDDFDMSNPD